jgi:hypothetical protein
VSRQQLLLSWARALVGGERPGSWEFSSGPPREEGPPQRGRALCTRLRGTGSDMPGQAHLLGGLPSRRLQRRRSSGALLFAGWSAPERQRARRAGQRPRSGGRRLVGVCACECGCQSLSRAGPAFLLPRPLASRRRLVSGQQARWAAGQQQAAQRHARRSAVCGHLELLGVR